MPKLLIADANEDFRTALANELQSHFQVLTCASGAQALTILRTQNPDILVLDLMLRELDGLTLLEQMQEEGIHPAVLVISSALTEYIYQSFHLLGISFALLKPCRISVAAHRARSLLKLPKSRPESDRSRVTQLLLSLHVATKHKGFAYLLEGILILSEDFSQSITKELYSEVARRCGCKRENVEHPMRNALESAWQQGDAQIWKRFFPEHTKRPTNAEFLTRIAQELQKRPE